MKKILSLVLALVLVLGVAGAMAVGSKSQGDMTVVTTKAAVTVVTVDDTEETTALKKAFADAIKAGDPKAALPEDVAAKVSDDLKSVNEFVTAKLDGEVAEGASLTLNLVFPTKYEAGEEVAVLFGIPNGDETKWIVADGTVESDGSITVTLSAADAAALAGKTFAIVVLSK